MYAEADIDNATATPRPAAGNANKYVQIEMHGGDDGEYAHIVVDLGMDAARKLHEQLGEALAALAQKAES
ncbi:MAG: hypothetical protein JRN42_05875 [Nitrososphaerota archaeon]|nr:hypothetical protein [Nitrososphaerota archaeon]